MQRIQLALVAALLCGGAGAAAPAPIPHAAGSAPAGIDLAGMDRSVKPGDDFDAYANGGWRKTAVIPDDRSSTGIFLQVFNKAESRTADIIRKAGEGNPKAGSEARKIADYYAAYMDEAAIEKRGLAPLKPELDAIAAIQDPAGLARAFGGQLRTDVDPVNNTNFG